MLIDSPELHVLVIGSVTTVGDIPRNAVTRCLYVAGFAVNAIFGMNTQFLMATLIRMNFIDGGRTEILARCAILLNIYGLIGFRIIHFKMRHLLFVVG